LKYGHCVAQNDSEPLWGQGPKRVSPEPAFAKLRLFLPWRAFINLKPKNQRLRKKMKAKGGSGDNVHVITDVITNAVVQTP